MGDILYYKNQTFKTTIQDMPYGEFSAKSCYLKSIMTLMEDKRYKLNSEDLNNTYEVCFRIFQYASLFKHNQARQILPRIIGIISPTIRTGL